MRLPKLIPEPISRQFQALPTPLSSSPLDPTADSYLLAQWFLWLLTGTDTPLAPWQQHHLTIRTADLLQRTLKDADPHPHIWLGIAHQTRQLINTYSKQLPIHLPYTAKADLHFAGVLSSITHHAGATGFLTSTNHFWTLCWTAYGEDPEIHAAHRHTAGADAAANTMFAVFNLHHHSPDPSTLADDAVLIMAHRLTALAVI